MWKHKNFINLQLYAGEIVGETWVLNETINFSTINNITVSVNFVSDGVVYSIFDVGTSSVGYGTTNQEAWSANNYTTSTGWKKEAYRTVTFDTGFDDPDEPLYKFLVANGTKQSASTPTFKHFYDAGLQGSGSIKFRHYSQSEPSTGETWVLNDTPTKATTAISVDINYVSNNITYSHIMIASQTGVWRTDGIIYGANAATGTVVYGSIDGWVNTAYKTVTFSTSPTGDLLTWLQANGTKQGGGGGAVTDLTGYTWVGNDTLSSHAAIEYALTFTTSYTAPGTSQVTEFDGVKFEFSTTKFGSTLDYADAVPNGLTAYNWDVSEFSVGWQDPLAKTIVITGGTDATNADLIEWLQANGTLTETQ